MTENVSFEIENNIFHGELKYTEYHDNEIVCRIEKNSSKVLQDIFIDEDNSMFNISGTLENQDKFYAINCYIDSGINPLSYLLIKNDDKLEYKIKIGTLYIGTSIVNKVTNNIKKCEFIISNEIPFLKHNKNIYISKHNINIEINEKIVIEFQNSFSLIELNQLLFDLKTFFQILVLNKDIEIVKKFFYLEDETKIEEIIKYKNNELSDKSKINFLVRENYQIDIENIFNLWFEAKEKYGRIFDYLSSILKESTLRHIDFKLFALSQWIEAYTREFLKNKVLLIVNESELSVVEKKLLKILNSDVSSFRTNLNGIFIIKQLEVLLFEKENRNRRDGLIHDIVCYRNNLTHINVANTLNMQQAGNLYEILKNLIYIFIMDELNINNDFKYEMFIKEAKHFYKQYYILSSKIAKCKS